MTLVGRYCLSYQNYYAKVQGVPSNELDKIK